MRIAGKIALSCIGFGFWGCRLATHESPMPVSLAQQRLDKPDTEDLAAFLVEWHPQDWRAHLARALAARNSAERHDALTAALWLKPREPLLLYVAALDRLAAHALVDDSVALWYLEEAMGSDPGNGVLDLTRAVAWTRLGRIHEARAVFRETRGFPVADLYGARLEQALLGVLELGLRLNPYDLIRAEEWYRNLPLPPIQEWSEALEKIFLDPLREHPDDMRRGRESARGLYRLGRGLQTRSLNPDRIFSDGREERLLGLMLEAKAADFLVHYAAAFGGDPNLDFQGMKSLRPRLRNALRVAAVPPPDWDHFLAEWKRIGEKYPTLTIGEASEKLRGEMTWRKVLRLRTHP
jgi:hypothetical protein